MNAEPRCELGRLCCLAASVSATFCSISAGVLKQSCIVIHPSAVHYSYPMTLFYAVHVSGSNDYRDVWLLHKLQCNSRTCQTFDFCCRRRKTFFCTVSNETLPSWTVCYVNISVFFDGNRPSRWESLVTTPWRGQWGRQGSYDGGPSIQSAWCATCPPFLGRWPAPQLVGAPDGSQEDSGFRDRCERRRMHRTDGKTSRKAFAWWTSSMFSDPTVEKRCVQYVLSQWMWTYSILCTLCSVHQHCDWLFVPAVAIWLAVFWQWRTVIGLLSCPMCVCFEWPFFPVSVDHCDLPSPVSAEHCDWPFSNRAKRCDWLL